MAAILAGPVWWSPDLPACLTSPWIFPAISSVSEAEVAASLWPAGEVSFYGGAVGFRHAILGDRPPRYLRATESYLHAAIAFACAMEWSYHH